MSDLNDKLNSLTIGEDEEVDEEEEEEDDDDYNNEMNRNNEQLFKINKYLSKQTSLDQDMIIECTERNTTRSFESNQIIDDSDLSQFQMNDENYLVKENLVNLLKAYKNLVNHDQQPSESSLSSYTMEKVRQENEKMILHKIKCILLNKSDQDFNDDLSNLDNQDDHLPRNLIVTSIPTEIFSNLDIKSKFEHMFLNIDELCKFCYFRVFKRCCIQYENPISAILARFELDDQPFLDDKLRIFLTRPIKVKNSRPFLEPPKNDKTFLISPPSSPPVDWSQHFEDPPVVNYDLLAALSKLNPGKFDFY
jgi:hypothetical protein